MPEDKPKFRLKQASSEELNDRLKAITKAITGGQDGVKTPDHAQLGKLRLARDAVEKEMASRGAQMNGRETLKEGIEELIASAMDKPEEPKTEPVAAGAEEK